MGFSPLRAAGLALGVLGLAGALAATLLPQWRVSAFVGANIVVLERIWEGLWMTCVRQARATLQCKPHGSLLALPPALGAARALMCVAVALALAALPVGACGLRRVRCAGSSSSSSSSSGGGGGERAQANLLGASGALLLLAGLCVLIPVSWTARVVVREFRDPAVHAGRKRDLGAALFVGWASAALLLAGGALLCGACCCGRRLRERGPRCPPPRDRVPCGGPHGDRAAPRKPFTSYV